MHGGMWSRVAASFCIEDAAATLGELHSGRLVRQPIHTCCHAISQEY
jgi:hypothetical protein